MGDYIQPAAIAATAIVSLAIGFGAAGWISSSPQTNGPIINPSAWEDTAPTPQAQTVSFSNTAPASAIKPAAAKCSPWEITDIAMEEVLDDMINRGWRPPNQGEAISSMGVSTIAAQDPNAPMPYRRTWASADPAAEAVSEQSAAAPAEPATPAESVGASAQPVAIDQPPASPLTQ